MASPIGARGCFDIASDSKGSSIPIQISEESGVQAENLSLSTWGSALVLANLLHQLDIAPAARDQSDHPSVLELGAGTGLAGLSAAALWQRGALLTDLPTILPGIAANISLNQHLFTAQPACYGTLDWTRPDQIHLAPHTGSSSDVIHSKDLKVEVILAADTIYSEYHPELLVQTITEWLAPTPTSRAVLCYPLRIAYIDHIRAFWDLMEASGFECWNEGRESGDETWNEVANTPYEWCVWKWKTR